MSKGNSRTVKRRHRERVSGSTALVQGLAGHAGSGNVPGLAAFEDEYLADYHPHAKQRQLHAAIDERFACVIAGRRGGKTYACGREFLRRVFRDYERFLAGGGTWISPQSIGPETKPSLEYWVISPTYALSSFPKREIFEVLGGTDSDLILKYNQSTGVLWLVGGICISFKSGDRPDKLVAAGLAGIWIDEAARMKSDVWEENVYATLSDHGGWCLFSSTPLGKNWLYKQIWQHTQLGRKEHRAGYFGVHWTTADNTANQTLVEEALRASKELPEPVYLRNYAASFEAFKGKVYSDFLDDETHLVTRIPWERVVRKWGGLDWGYNNPGVQVEIAQIDDGTLYAYNEDYADRLTITPPPERPTADAWVNRLQFASSVRDVEYWWADPSRPEHAETCDDYGLDVRSADNAVQAGIEAVATLLKPVKRGNEPGRGRPALYIHRDCENLRRELSGYRYRDDSEKPVKEDDHAPDALRYGVFSEHRSGGGLVRLDFSIFQDAA